ncbi:ATP-dependent Clp protease proteolytic subunit [Candidatus Albibeggiatoa sp. nov. NOAA]|uniref:ATP-dependent Clp protease proteolytic subunit n=1 Tax=Candidatus Albibeggiatoa sp. nov. NOAA TaxID=3162724 RepID=UPI0032F1212D|nr:ATP-dependent Clp protease proteolytic subunit [Thiotrichaceae bacterium]
MLRKPLTSLGYWCTCLLMSANVAVHAETTAAENETATAPTQPEPKQISMAAQPVTLQDVIVATTNSAIVSKPKKPALSEQVLELKEESTIISLENSIQAEKFRSELLGLEHEKNKLMLENEVLLEKTRHQLAELNAEKERILLENDVTEAKQTQLLANLVAEKTRLELENAISDEEQTQHRASTTKEKAELKLQNEIAEQKNRSEELKIQLEVTKLNFELSKLEFEKAKRTADIEELSERITEREQRELWESEANKQPELLEDPFVNGQLILSDRKIELDPIIMRGTAEYVNERIDYFNNKDPDYPIFIVIDVCYGGSVAEGAKILEAMEASSAPVYVVVKSLAASMAAVITTLAERSYAYPNAILIHHQMWGGFIGNIKEQKEQLAMMQEWANRLMKPVSDKMGVPMDEFVDMMYEHNSTGDWNEFADDAVSLKWVDYITEDIRDTSYIKEPSEENKQEDFFIILKSNNFRLKEQLDTQGNKYVQLPRLGPYDFYHLYNPDNYYRY